MHILRRLRNDPQATWKVAEQREAIITALQLRRDMICEMRTSSGKSMVVIIPSILEYGYTFLLPGLRSLGKDWCRRLDYMNVKYEHYKGAKSGFRIEGKHNLIISSLDIAKGAKWEEAVIDLLRRCRRPLLRFAIDESQLTMMDSKWRNALDNIFRLRAIAPCQIVLLSANVPPVSIPFLKDKFQLTDPVILRTHSCRTEIRYVIESKVDHTHQALVKVKALINLHMAGANPSQDRFMIYVQFLADGEFYAKELGLEFYHAVTNTNDITDDDLDGIYNRWCSGQYKGLITTHALSAGNDYPHVRLVIHIGSPGTMIGWYQESSRAGRDEQIATAVVIPTSSQFFLTESTEEWRRINGVKEMRVLLEMTSTLPLQTKVRCVRFRLTRFNDGSVGYTCVEVENAQLCCFCLERESFFWSNNSAQSY